MKRLLLTLLTAIALPNAVNAESYWLILRWKASNSGGLEKIQMVSIEECENEGTKWQNTELTKEERIYKKEAGGKRSVIFGYHCVIGK